MDSANGLTADELARRLSARPRVRLAQLPTPLHPARRFSAEVGAEVWLKRDDLTGVAMGGNKIRKLEFLLGEAREAGADCLITMGAAQSNHARTVAAGAAMSGLPCHLVLGGDRPDRPTGNILLSTLLGAELHFTGLTDWDDLARASEDLRATLAADGHRPYVIPVGGSTPYGALGFAAAYLELLEQTAAEGIEPGVIVHATASGGTQSGLHAAHRLLFPGGDGGPAVYGVVASGTADELMSEVTELAGGVAELLGGPRAIGAPHGVDGFLGEGYGVSTPGGEAALRLLLRTEGVLTDPVYTAKALHAVVERGAELAAGRPLVFWHTGGTPAVFSDEHSLVSW
jgi:1-aminocyclopropane-1-carboxylate deaminase/D-cysteine desulfhydrase-like pyridoxal-dependent ACC family enzyme